MKAICLLEQLARYLHFILDSNKLWMPRSILEPGWVNVIFGSNIHLFENANQYPPCLELEEGKYSQLTAYLVDLMAIFLHPPTLSPSLLQLKWTDKCFLGMQASSQDDGAQTVKFTGLMDHISPSPQSMTRQPPLKLRNCLKWNRQFLPWRPFTLIIGIKYKLEGAKKLVFHLCGHSS